MWTASKDFIVFLFIDFHINLILKTRLSLYGPQLDSEVLLQQCAGDNPGLLVSDNVMAKQTTVLASCEVNSSPSGCHISAAPE